MWLLHDGKACMYFCLLFIYHVSFIFVFVRASKSVAECDTFVLENYVHGLNIGLGSVGETNAVILFLHRDCLLSMDGPFLPTVDQHGKKCTACCSL